ncbi:MAG: DMT family transporter [Candidatus Kapaibacterium sp.]
MHKLNFISDWTQDIFSKLDNTTKGILFAATTALFWGFLGIFLKIALKELDSMTIIWMRFVVAFSVLSLWLAIRRPSEFKIYRKMPPLLIVAALSLGFNYIGYMKGVEHAGPATAQILIQTAQVMLVLVGIFIFKERLNRKQMVGIAIVTVGFLLFYSERIGGISTTEDSYNLGVAYTLFGAAIWVVYAAIQKKLVASHSAQQLNMIIYLVPVFMFVWFADFEALAGLSFNMWILVIFLGLNTLIAYGSLAEAFKYLQASKVSIIITLNPIITITTLTIMAYLEVTIIETTIISVLGFVGAILVVTGAILAITKKKQLKVKA